MKVLPIMILAVALSACSDLDEQKDVYVSLNPPTLTITNSISEPIYYFVVGQKETAYTDWITSCDETNRIQQGRTRSLEYTRQLRAGESILIVYWWKGRLNERGTLDATGMTSIEVRIR